MRIQTLLLLLHMKYYGMSFYYKQLVQPERSANSREFGMTSKI